MSKSAVVGVYIIFINVTASSVDSCSPPWKFFVIFRAHLAFVKIENYQNGWDEFPTGLRHNVSIHRFVNLTRAFNSSSRLFNRNHPPTTRVEKRNNTLLPSPTVRHVRYDRRHENKHAEHWSGIQYRERCLHKYLHVSTIIVHTTLHVRSCIRRRSFVSAPIPNTLHGCIIIFNRFFNKSLPRSSARRDNNTVERNFVILADEFTTFVTRYNICIFFYWKCILFFICMHSIIM